MKADVLPKLRHRFRWRGTPWRAIALRHEATHVDLQTVQHEVVLTDLVRTGVHRPPRWDDGHDFAEAYEWMSRQMAMRLPTDGGGIVWTWAQGRRRDLKSTTISRDEVLLRCRIPRERVLVSHFADWHCVLNRIPFVAPLPGEGAESYGRRTDPVFDAFYARLDVGGMSDSSTRTWPADLREEVEASWEAIFDADYWTGSDVLQATVHEIRACDVVEIIRFR